MEGGASDEVWREGPQMKCTYFYPLYLLKPGLGPLQWKSYFDYLITDANKPLFFTEGSMLREVDEVG